LGIAEANNEIMKLLISLEFYHSPFSLLVLPVDKYEEGLRDSIADRQQH